MANDKNFKIKNGLDVGGTITSGGVALGGIGSFISNSIAISSDGTAGSSDDGTTNANISIGKEANQNSTTGSYTIAIGENSLRNGGTGITHGVFIGANTASSGAASGTRNTAVGNNSLTSLSTGTHNTILGTYAGSGITTGSHNIGIGSSGLGYAFSTPALTGSYNIGMGFEAGHAITTGQYNVLSGYQAGYRMTTGLNNIAIGKEALWGNANGVTGTENIAIGTRTIQNDNGSDFNVAIGYWAGFNIKNGVNNIALGKEAGKSILYGSYNTILGAGAGYNIGVSTSSCVFIGKEAGYSESASNKLHIANNSTESLIEGDFSAKTLNINGALTVNGAAVGGGVNITSNATAPSSPAVGDQWYDTTNGVLYVRVTDGTDAAWLDISSANGTAAAGASGGAMELISTTTVTSATASVSFTNMTGYKKYILMANGELTAAKNCYFQLGTSGSYVTSGYNYNSHYFANATASYYGAASASASSTSLTFHGYGSQLSAVLTVTPNSTNTLVRFASEGMDGTNTSGKDGVVFLAGTVADSIEIVVNGGTIATGTFSLYGIKS